MKKGAFYLKSQAEDGTFAELELLEQLVKIQLSRLPARSGIFSHSYDMDFFPLFLQFHCLGASLGVSAVVRQYVFCVFVSFLFIFHCNLYEISWRAMTYDQVQAMNYSERSKVCFFEGLVL